MMMENMQGEFNSLVREAFDAQQAFDDWDEGYTLERGFTSNGWHKRVVDLDTVAKEWDAANLKLIDFVATNHEALREHITKEETK